MDMAAERGRGHGACKGAPQRVCRQRRGASYACRYGPPDGPAGRSRRCAYMSHVIRQWRGVRRATCSFGSLALSALAAIACLLGAACNDTNDLGNPFPVILFSPIEGTSVFL